MIKSRLFFILCALHVVAILFAISLLWRQPGETRRDKETIVVLPIEGVITMQGRSMGSGDVDEIVRTIDKLTDRDEVKALVLKINSPGGSVGAVQAIHASLERFRKKGKHVVSSFGDVAASGGYYVACAGDKIVSYPGTLTGSIGVVMQMPNVTGLLQKVGVRMETFTSGALKDAGSPFRTMTADEQKYFRELVLDAYGQFFDAVKAGRRIPEADLRKVADGRVMSGRRAFELKLVDKLGGLSDAVDLAKEISGLEGKNPKIVEHQEKASLEKILGLLSRSPIDALGWTETGVSVSYLLN